MITMITRLAAVALLLPLAGPIEASDSDWGQWRGPNGTGFTEAHPPTEWSAERNVRWKTAIPGNGLSSPVVWGDRIYLMTAIKTGRTPEGAPPPEPANDEGAAPRGDQAEGGGAPDDARPGRGNRGGREGERGGRGGGRGGRRGAKPSEIHEFAVVAVDRSSGNIAWVTNVAEGVPHEGAHSTGSFASNSPVTDGTHVFAFFGSRGVHCLDLQGKVVWHKDLGDQSIQNSFGEGASAALHGDTLVVPWDHEGDSFIAAFDKNTGAERWRQPRDEKTNWSTPVMTTVGDATLVIVPGANATVAYDLKTGKERWRCAGLANGVIPTPIVAHGMVYLTCGGMRGGAFQAIRLEGASGDLTGTGAIAWSLDRGTPHIPSPLLAGRHLYYLRGDNGILSCVDALTGESLYSGERIEGLGTIYASPVGAAGHIYVCDRDGNVAVVAEGAEFKVVATNALGEGISATPAIVADTLLIRGEQHLFCIGEPSAKP